MATWIDLSSFEHGNSGVAIPGESGIWRDLRYDISTRRGSAYLMDTIQQIAGHRLRMQSIKFRSPFIRPTYPAGLGEAERMLIPRFISPVPAVICGSHHRMS